MLSLKAPAYAWLHKMKEQVTANTAQGVVLVCGIFIAQIILYSASIVFGVLSYMQHSALPNGYAYIGVVVFALAILFSLLWGQIESTIMWMPVSVKNALGPMFIILIGLSTIPIWMVVTPFVPYVHP